MRLRSLMSAVHDLWVGTSPSHPCTVCRRPGTSTASAGATGLGYRSWLTIRTKPFWVIAQDAHPVAISPVQPHPRPIMVDVVAVQQRQEHLVRPLMSYGKDERHVDKHLWKLPIPRYDETDPQHRQLADLGHACAEYVKTLDLDEGGNFVTLRRRVRSALAACSPAVEANTLVVSLLGPSQ